MRIQAFTHARALASIATSLLSKTGDYTTTASLGRVITDEDLQFAAVDLNWIRFPDFGVLAGLVSDVDDLTHLNLSLLSIRRCCRMNELLRQDDSHQRLHE